VVHVGAQEARRDESNSQQPTRLFGFRFLNLLLLIGVSLSPTSGKKLFCYATTTTIKQTAKHNNSFP
jgi:hypothetical protein